MKYSPKPLIEKIINAGYKVKINYRVVKGKYVLFLNYRKTHAGGVKQETKRLCVLQGDNKTDDLIEINKAINIRADFEKSLKSETGVFQNKASKILLSDYFDANIATYTNKRVAHTRKAYKRLVFQYSNKAITLSEINKEFCIGYYDFLRKLGHKSACHEWKYFKMIINNAIDDELIENIPNLRKLSIPYHPPLPRFLTINEVSQVKDAEIPEKLIQYKNAFLFACFTGLRFVDLNKLKFSDIVEGKLIIKQQKTKEPVANKLNPTALKILEEQRLLQGDKPNVFSLVSYRCWRVAIKRLRQHSALEKDLTGHYARHTTGTLLRTAGVDIQVISKILGHSNMNTTQIYATVVDKVKDDAIDKLPVL